MVIRTSNLSKKYKDRVAVDHLNLEVGENRIYGLLGVNGAGKTTTIKRLCGLLEPTEGDGTVLGYSISKERNRIKPLIGVSTQETSIAKNLTVKENLDFYASLYSRDRAEKERRIDELGSFFGFGSRMGEKAGKLSGGWQRKLSIALALLHKPKVLFLDEPTLGLDVLSRHELWNLIRGLKKDAAIVLTSHYLEEVEALADEIGIRNKGILCFSGKLPELYKKTGKDNLEDAFVSIAEGTK